MILTAGAATGALVLEMTQPKGPPHATLTVYQPIGTLPGIFALETTGAVLADRIEVRYPASLTYEPGPLEENWTSQSTTINEALSQVGITTFDYAGSDPAESDEFFSFHQPWSATFSFTDPMGGSTLVDVPVRVDVFARAPVPGSGLVSVSATEFLVVTIPEPASPTLGVLALAVTLLRRRRAA